MSDTGQSLLAAVLASPEDDQPRLIFADWLDEQGECDRAEFIRVQCEYDQHCDPHERAPKWEHLRRRERELFGPACFGGTVRWGHRTHYDLPDTLDTAVGDDVRLVYRRGFVESITCTSADWLSHADAILAAQPVREVRLTTHPDFAALAARCPRVNVEAPWVENMLRHLWPRVTFTLPPAEVAPTVRMTPQQLRELFDITEDFAAGLRRRPGVPFPSDVRHEVRYPPDITC